MLFTERVLSRFDKVATEFAQNGFVYNRHSCSSYSFVKKGNELGIFTLSVVPIITNDTVRTMIDVTVPVGDSNVVYKKRFASTRIHTIKKYLRYHMSLH